VTGSPLAIELPSAVVDEIVERVAAVVLERVQAPAVSPYLSVDEAADYLRCSRQRIYDLLSSRRLTKLKDGSRVLVRRDELDDHLSGVAASLPRASQGRSGRAVAA
jgi:excisionase family DNA binding protein